MDSAITAKQISTDQSPGRLFRAVLPGHTLSDWQPSASFGQRDCLTENIDENLTSRLSSTVMSRSSCSLPRLQTSETLHSLQDREFTPGRAPQGRAGPARPVSGPNYTKCHDVCR
eukprot:748743-Hanusia_phi.AAC.3